MIKKIALALTLLALTACGGNDTPATTGNGNRGNIIEPGSSLTIKPENVDEFDDDEKPVLDSIVRWMDGNGNFHVDVYSNNFPVKGDSGVFITLVLN